MYFRRRERELHCVLESCVQKILRLTPFATTAIGREAEETRRKFEQELQRAQKLEGLGVLAGGIAHDFNNLLTVILGFSRPLLDEFASDDPKREDIVAICDSADRAAMLTRQLLTFSRRQAVETQALQLNDLLRGLQRLLEGLMGSDIAVVFELSDALPFVEGDPHQIEQALLNIASNSRDAMPDGGQFSVRTRSLVISAEQASSLGLDSGGEFVELEIGDTGHGMDEETRQHIFDPFFTTKEQGKGTGLGLSIVYSIVEHAGGTIMVDVDEGKGTIFRILLPACEQ
jgi:signal transduction histidine kinase